MISAQTIILLLLVGAAFALFFYIKVLPVVVDKLKSTPVLIRSYWIYSLVFLTVGLLLNYLNYRYNPLEDLSFSGDLINFYTGLTFAIYTGYTAFKQYQETRYEKIKNEAGDYFRQGEAFFERARRLFQEAFSINPKDDVLINEYAELSMLLSDWGELKRLIERLNKVKVERYRKITIYYLKIGEELIKEHIGDAKKEIRKMLKFIDKHPTVFKEHRWSYKELKNSRVYKKLEKGDAAKLFEATVNYLERKDKEGLKKIQSLL